jgi:hypothetical protein
MRDESGIGMLCSLLRPYIEISNIENLFAFSFKLKSLQPPKENGWEIYNPITVYINIMKWNEIKSLKSTESKFPSLDRKW